ncbi:unnamed protein product, partial [Chrysoparadoxa australica]
MAVRGGVQAQRLAKELRLGGDSLTEVKEALLRLAGMALSSKPQALHGDREAEAEVEAWHEVLDPATGGSYFLNDVTGETALGPPEEESAARVLQRGYRAYRKCKTSRKVQHMEARVQQFLTGEAEEQLQRGATCVEASLPAQGSPQQRKAQQQASEDQDLPFWDKRMRSSRSSCSSDHVLPKEPCSVFGL